MQALAEEGPPRPAQPMPDLPDPPTRRRRVGDEPPAGRGACRATQTVGSPAGDPSPLPCEVARRSAPASRAVTAPFDPILLAAAGGVIAVSAAVAVIRRRGPDRRLELLHRMTCQLLESHDPRAELMLVLAELRRLLNAGSTEVLLVEGDEWRRTELVGTQATAHERCGQGWPSELTSLPPVPAHLDQLPGPGHRWADVRDRLGPGVAVAPVRSDGAVIGMVSAGQPAGRTRFSPADLRLLGAVTNQLAAVLDRSRLHRQLRHDATHDQLTGLLNRLGFSEQLADHCTPGAVLLMDLDGFKDVNDALGHREGDRLIIEAAARVSGGISHGAVARVDGDEFGVLLPGAGRQEAARAAGAVLSVLSKPFHVGGVPVEIGASVGVAVRDGRGEPDRLLLEAEVAMYAAKASRRGWEIYDPAHHPTARERLSMAADLRRAIDHAELDVYYQPKLDLRDGSVPGVEALVRWRHPRRGLLGPETFIAEAERAGLIPGLTFLVLEAAVAQQRVLRKGGFDLEMAVNLSLRSMVEPDFPDRVADVLRRHGMPASALTLEVTESSVMTDPARTISMLGRLVEMGATISVDDFGTGYASLSHLKRLPAGEIKIDRSFVAGMLDEARDAAIVASTIALARNLGVRAVAEGVEDGATCAALAALGCDCAQGYFVGKPMAVEQLGRWLVADGRAVQAAPADAPGARLPLS